MSRKLLLLRHGKSNWNVNVSDLKRPLKKRGSRAAQKMGVWLYQQNLQPDYILSSPAKRASQTAEKSTNAMGLTTQQIHYDPRLYATHLDDLKTVLAECPADANTILVIGHNPDLELLLEYLSRDRLKIPDDGKLLATATVAVLAMPDDWHILPNGCARVISIMRPALLP